MKAQDVFNASTPFLGTTTSFEKAFPGVAEAEVKVTEEGDDVPGGSRSTIYRKPEIPEYVNCSNPRCYNGGVRVGGSIRLMMPARQTEWTDQCFCQGYEGSPKGRINRGPCDHFFRVKISIVYQDS